MATSDTRPCAPDDSESVPAEFLVGNGGQRDPGTVSSERVDVTDPPAALIVSTTVGWPITGGIPAALRLLITLLHSIGFAVYCTVYKMTGHDQNFCRKVGLNMIKPKPPIHLRREQPALSWLHKPEIFYNDLLELENVKVVFGLDIVTSPPAEEIQREYFPNAAFCLINVFSHDTLESNIDYEHDELELLRQLYFQLSKNCSAIFSIGSSLFQYFTLEYQAKELLVKFNHYRLLHYPDEDNFQQAVPTFLPSGEHFQILTLVNENDIANLTSDSILGKAMYAMAENLSNILIVPPTWKILGVRKGREDEVIARLNPHPKQKIIFKPFPPADFDHELKTSQVVLVPPSSPNSVDLSLNAMTLCKPVIIPEGSPSHTPVKQYLREFEADIVVDMKVNFENLKARIIKTVVKYKQFLKKADETRAKLKTVITKVKGIMRQMIIDVIEQHTDSTCVEVEVPPQAIVEGNTTESQQSQLTEEEEINEEVVTKTDGSEDIVEEVQDHQFTGHSVGDSDISPAPNPTPLHDSEQPVNIAGQREGKREHNGAHHKGNPGHGQYERSPRNNEKSMKIQPSTSDNPANNTRGQDCVNIRLHVRDGVPEDDKHMDEVQRDFFRHERTHGNSLAYMRRLMYIHPELSGDDVGEGSLIFRVKCGSSAAAKALWAAYGSGRLDKMADDTFLTLDLMDDIGARCLSLETLIDYADYISCLDYFREKEMRLSTERGMSYEEIDLDTLKERKLHLISEKKIVEMQNDISRVQSTDKTWIRRGLLSDHVREQDIFEREIAAISEELCDMKYSIKVPTGNEKLEELLEWQTSRLAKLKAMYSTHTGEIDELQVAMGRLHKDRPLNVTIRRLSRSGEKPGEVLRPRGLTINRMDM
ncbi:uncharacterized protein [Ptychodera flava]|uniref:uncharacterized protein n=1 Tax=Ptychodera flava TaxID=63121 RepID=UPI003969C433